MSRNDCSRELACVRNTCVPGGLNVSATDLECYRVECAEHADCCSDFIPDDNCDIYEASCEANPTQCLAYLSLCVCNHECESERCFDRGPRCMVDDQCAFSSRPHCVAQTCVACREHGDCESDERCEDGACVAVCARDEQCPLMWACVNSACEYRGCTSDRECVFLLGDGRARCAASACEIGCEADWECDESRREVCDGGVCVFAGCTSNDECRIILDIANEPSAQVQAVCR